jgi:3-hydroxyacyl-CoA dehydrogenase
VGIELTQDVHREVFPKLSRETEPNPILQKMLDAGEKGMASGKGFYAWTPEAADTKRKELSEHLLRLRRGQR